MRTAMSAMSGIVADASNQATRRARAQVPSAPVLGLRRNEALSEWVVSGNDPVGHRNLPPSVHAELRSERVAMRLRGTRGDTEALAELVVRKAGREQLHDFHLPRGELGCRDVRCHGARLVRPLLTDY